jgi:preprotein translocase subunit SecA
MVWSSLRKGATQVATGIFGTKSERDLRALQPIMQAIHEAYPALASLSDEALRAKTEELRARLAHGEALDDLLPEAFAVVKDACRRRVGQSWSVVGQEIRWDMVPYDVQLVGGIVLH